MEDKGHGGLRRVPTAHSPLIACRLPPAKAQLVLPSPQPPQRKVR